ncbi:AraC family transcriptional regulator [Paenibacillus chartarius]|uniref:AraC family transcriptional regulator n=1 Tax=Paenibacillus chartarius TaxID=747481 RepID=A0ABV6DU58_9BACL
MGDQRFGFLTLTEIERQLPVYMSGAGYWSSQEEIVRPNGYPLYQWLYCVDGEGELWVRGERSEVKPGFGIFLSPHEPHEYRATTEPWEIYWLNFEGVQAESMARTAGLARSGVYRLAGSDAVMLNHMQSAVSLVLSGNPLAGLECSKLVYALLLDIMKGMADPHASLEMSFRRLQPVFDYMERHYARRVTLQELADTVGVSGQHLCMLFRKIVDARPMEYLNKLRIRKSKEQLLAFPQDRIGEVARKAGFETVGYFCVLFKQMEGVSPDTFRKLNGVR